MINYLQSIIFFSSFLIVLIFTAIVFHHLKDRYYEKKYLAKKRRWENQFLAYLNNEITVNQLKNIFAEDYLYLYDFLKKYLMEDDDYINAKTINLVKEINMDDYFLKKLKSKNRELKIKSALFLSLIGDKRALPLLEKYLNTKDELLLRASIWSIAEIGEIKLYDRILKLVINETKMTFESLTELSIRFGRDICVKVSKLIEAKLKNKVDFKEIYGAENFELLSLFIDIFGYFRYKKSLPLLKKIIHQSDNEEVIIHIFKASVKIKEDLEIDLEKYLRHSNWVIRSQTAHYISVIQAEKYLDELLVLLKNDSKWWVRYYAGLAVYKIGRKDLLKEIVVQNHQGREMSKYILELNSLGG